MGSRRFDSHTHWSWKVGIKLLHAVAFVLQSRFHDLACGGVQHRQRLLASVQITSYNPHLGLLRSEHCRVNTAQFTRAVGRPASLRHQSGSENVSGAVGARGRLTLSSRVAIWVNINYSVNMAISKIRKYLDDLRIQADAARGQDIGISGVPKTREPILPVLLTELEWKDKRTGLTARRHGLSEQFEVTPDNIRLGQEIKGLDDQIAKCTEHMRLKR